MNIHGINPASLSKSAEVLPSDAKKDADLKKTCKEFESLFLNQLLTAMRKTIPKSEGEDGGDGHEKEMYQGMMDQELAKSWSQTDGIGLANVLYQQLTHKA